MRAWRLVVPVLGLLAVLGGCAQYNYKDQSYGSAEEGIAAIRTDLDSILAGITPVADPLGGSALVVLPTRDALRANALKTTGPVSDEAVDYILDANEMQLRAIVDGVERGKVFDSMTVEQAFNPDNVPYDQYDYKLWLYSDQTTAVWYLQLGTEGLSVPMDMSRLESEQFGEFNESIVVIGRRLAAE